MAERNDISVANLNRRTALMALGASASAGLAGCLGDDDDGDADDGDDSDADSDSDADDGDSGDDLGERVPTVSHRYWSNIGDTSRLWETVAPIIQENVQDGLGVQVEINPGEFATVTSGVYNDERHSAFEQWGHSNDLTRLDPQEMTRRFGVDWAGANGLPNNIQYADCEYSYHALAQARATDPVERQEHVNEAHAILSDDAGVIPYFGSVDYSAYRADTVEMDGAGAGGLWDTNPPSLIKSTPTEGDQLTYNITQASVESEQFPTQTYISGIWTRLAHSPLRAYDENWELQNILAESVEVEDDFTTVTVELRDASFHNGDPITSEDVKFTFELLNANSDIYPFADPVPYESIEAVDEQTTVFNLERAYPALTTLTFPKWGIFHKASWEPALDERENFVWEDPWIGSGPFQVTDFQVGDRIVMEPHPEDGHPVYSVDHGLFMQIYRETATVVEAFLAGELNVCQRIGAGDVERINDELGDNAESVISRPMFAEYIGPQMNIPPTKFRAFRAAVGASLDRQLMNELAQEGRGPVQSNATILMPDLPYYPNEEDLFQFTDDPTGDYEQAQQFLEDAGWGWDEDDNLHYPSDADLSPLWPDGETPSPEDYPCLTSEGELDPEWEPE